MRKRRKDQGMTHYKESATTQARGSLTVPIKRTSTLGSLFGCFGALEAPSRREILLRVKRLTLVFVSAEICQSPWLTVRSSSAHDEQDISDSITKQLHPVLAKPTHALGRVVIDGQT